jgi:hypothetical protein
LEAPGIGKISFRLDNDCAREKINGLGWEMVLRY